MEDYMKKIISRIAVVFAAAILVSTFTGCLSLFTTTTSTVRAADPVLEGTWTGATNSYSYDIERSGSVYTFKSYTLLRDGTKSYNRDMTSFERGERRVETSTSGYLYGYNSSRPGWVAYYYTFSSSSATLTSLTTVSGGSVWSSLEEAKAGADKNYPGAVKINLKR